MIWYISCLSGERNIIIIMTRDISPLRIIMLDRVPLIDCDVDDGDGSTTSGR